MRKFLERLRKLFARVTQLRRLHADRLAHNGNAGFMELLPHAFVDLRCDRLGADSLRDLIRQLRDPRFELLLICDTRLVRGPDRFDPAGENRRDLR